MIIGVGVDIVKISRISRAVKTHGDKFLRRIYSDEEIEYCLKRKDPFPSLAARFAAKEAVIKAISEHAEVYPIDVAVKNNKSGSPGIVIAGRLKKAFTKAGVVRAHLSLSHDTDYAVAMAVLETSMKSK